MRRSINKPPETTLPLPTALFYILLSLVLVSGSCAIALLFYRHFKEQHRRDPAYTIMAVVQTTAGSESLKTVYLTELLGLSIDHPKNLYSFSSAEAEKNLLASPLIKAATIRKIRPGIIHVDYLMRQPRAFLADYTNTAIDSDGYLLPFKPFFTPKKLPEIYLGNIETFIPADLPSPWGVQLNNEKIRVAFDLLELANRHCCDHDASLSHIDLSQMEAPSTGRSQIVMVFEERHASKTYRQRLRLTPDDYAQELDNFGTLRAYLRKDAEFAKKRQTKDIVIDLRLSDLAFIAIDE